MFATIPYSDPPCYNNHVTGLFAARNTHESREKFSHANISWLTVLAYQNLSFMVLYPISRATYMYVRCNNFINGLIRRKMKTAFCDIIFIKQLYGNLLINIKIESKVW